MSRERVWERSTFQIEFVSRDPDILIFKYFQRKTCWLLDMGVHADVVKRHLSFVGSPSSLPLAG